MHSELTTWAGGDVTPPFAALPLAPLPPTSIASRRQAVAQAPQAPQPSLITGRSSWTLATRPSSAPSGHRYRHQKRSASRLSRTMASRTRKMAARLLVPRLDRGQDPTAKRLVRPLHDADCRTPGHARPLQRVREVDEPGDDGRRHGPGEQRQRVEYEERQVGQRRQHDDHAQEDVLDVAERRGHAAREPLRRAEAQPAEQRSHGTDPATPDATDHKGQSEGDEGECEGRQPGASGEHRRQSGEGVEAEEDVGEWDRLEPLQPGEEQGDEDDEGDHLDGAPRPAGGSPAARPAARRTGLAPL